MKHRTISTSLGFALSFLLVACGQVPIPTPPTSTSVATEISPSTPMSTSTPSLILTDTPHITPAWTLIDTMDELSSWTSSFCDDTCAGSKNGGSAIFLGLVPGQTSNAIEVLYDLRDAGWVLITRNIDGNILTKTTGISFSYRGSGAPDTIELKLLYSDSTTFGVAWHRATDTGGNWIPLKALYSEFTCWWPEDKCQTYGNNLSLTAISRIEFGISHKSGFNDKAGLGKVAFDNIAGIP